MTISREFVFVCSAALFVSGFSLGGLFQTSGVAKAQASHRVFELRTYTAAEGKLSALQARFRDHTMSIFARHAMTSIGYWVPEDAPLSQNTLVYLLAHPSREEAKKSWASFQADPEWQKTKADSEVQGHLAIKIESVFLDPLDFSPLK
jgi:NIPSNAP